VLEILSEDSVERDRTEKFDYYYTQGVAWYWIGDPVAGILEEYHHTPQGYVRSSSGSLQRPFEPRTLSGLSVPLSELLED